MNEQQNPYGRKRDELATAEELLASFKMAKMPNDPEAEKMLVGYCLMNPEWYQNRFTAITPALFYNEIYRTMAGAAMDILSEGSPLDPLTLSNRLRHEKTLNLVGGPAAVNETFQMYEASLHPDWHLKRLQKLAQQRRYITAMARGVDALLKTQIEQDGSLFSAVDEVKGLLEEATHMQGRRLKRLTMGEAMDQLLNEIQDRIQNPGRLPGWTTGFHALDKHLKGLQKGRVTVFAGMPSDGKSTIMQNCAMAALWAGAKVGWYSLEMPAAEQAIRILAETSGVENDDLYLGQMNRAQMEQMADAIRRLKEAGAEIIEVDGASATDIMQDIEQSGYDIAVVDYLQLLEDDQARKSDTRENIIAGISRRLKRLARRTQCHILTASQLNDQGRLRESRAIGQDADAVVVVNKCPLNRPEGAQDHDQFAEGNDDSRRLLMLEKNRGGKRGIEIPMHFLGSTFTFKEIIPSR